MKDYRVFDIIGPTMIGPSSSHTAGAARIAKTARDISDDGFNKVEFILHGSFAETFQGHGTDKALLAGVLGFGPDDERLRHSFEIAKEKGLEFSFEKGDLGNVHPNSARIIFHYPNGIKNSVTGSSIGGGNIEIVAINEVPITYTGRFPTLILKYQEQKGIVYYVSSILTKGDYNIETMRIVKQDDEVTLICETTEEVSEEIIEEILSDDRFTFAKYITGE